jgi:predicted nuclease of predicted toxin-antitoxin system
LKFVADENLDRQIVERLREDGHEVWYVAEMAPGVSDQEVLNLANDEQAVLLTADKDFGELVYRQRLANPGVILVRLAGLSSVVKANLVAGAIKAHLEGMAGDFVVISHQAIRRRHPKVFHFLPGSPLRPE